MLILGKNSKKGKLSFEIKKDGIILINGIAENNSALIVKTLRMILKGNHLRLEDSPS